jgi:lipopolysaccharide transport system ATP-binding protein
MKNDTVIQVEGLYKKFCRNLKRSMFYGIIDSSRSMMGIPYKTSKLRKAEFWALEEVGFEIIKGEKLGLIGTNGSGKTTLLRMISGIFPPDQGRIKIYGSVGSLIAVGAGFHPHMTGKENIYLNGTILGMSRKELNNKLDSIIEFAEIGDFIETPISMYSSGMLVRLGFSIAIHRIPDVMLVDEVLAVGDLSFQLKCQKKLGEFRMGGGTFIIVSHNMQMIRNTCTRVLWLEKGKIINEGDVNEICDEYEKVQLEKSLQSINDTELNILNYDDEVSIPDVQILNKENIRKDNFKSGELVKIRIHFRSRREVANPIFVVALFNSKGVVIFETYSRNNIHLHKLKGNGCIEFQFKDLYLKSDLYRISIMLSENDILNKLEWHEKKYSITVSGRGSYTNQGLLYPSHSWVVTQK